MDSILCPYCGAKADEVTGREIYPHIPSLASNILWACTPCKAWVGCHSGSNVPKGTLADKETRQARMHAHSEFDPLWKFGGITRGQAYKWLSETLGVEGESLHIGSMNAEQCAAVVAAVEGLRHGRAENPKIHRARDGATAQAGEGEQGNARRRSRAHVAGRHDVG